MSTTNHDTTFDLFHRAALSQDDLGYPNGTEFVPGDLENVDDIVWRNLHDEQRPVVVVFDDDEMLMAPCPLFWPFRLYDHVRGRVRVRVGWRRHGEQYAVTTHVGHHPLADMRRPLACP